MNKIQINRRVAILLITLFAALLFNGCDLLKKKAEEKKADGPTEKSVVVEMLRQKTMRDYVRISGIARARVERPLYFQQQGVIESIFAEEGDTVTSGTVLAELDSEVRRQRLELARLSLRVAEAEYETAEIDYKRNEDLQLQKAISLRTLEDSLLRYRQAESRKLSAEREVAISKLELRQTKLTAPIPGVVAYRNVKEGDYYNGPLAKAPFVMIQPELLDLEIFLPENLVSKIRENQNAELQYESKKFKGRVQRINPAVDLENRSVKVVVEVYNDQLEIKSGAFLEGRIKVFEKAATPVVPLKALIISGRKKYLFTASNDNIATRHLLTTGIEDERDVEILKPEFTSGTFIVVQGQYNLDSSDKIKRLAPIKLPDVE